MSFFGAAGLRSHASLLGMPRWRACAADVVRAPPVVQLQSYNFICLLQAACLVQAVCFSTTPFGNGPKSALILSGAGRLRTATNTDDQALSQVDPVSLLCRVDNRITARVRCRLN